MTALSPLRIPRAVLFDAEGTLFEIEPSVGHVYAEVCRRFHHPVSGTEINERVKIVWPDFKSDYLRAEKGYVTSHEQERGVWRRFSARLLPELAGRADFEAIFDAIYAEFAEGWTHRIYDGVEASLVALKDRGFILGILSNYDTRLETLVANLGLSSYFQLLLPTTKIGFKKPSIECFRFAEGALGLPSSDILYVGDDFELDYLASQHAGWQSLLFDPRSRHAGDAVKFRQYPELVELLT